MIRALLANAVCWGVATLLMPVVAHSAGAAPVNVVAEEYPPFLRSSRDGLTGPYADAFRLLMARQGLTINYQAMPVRRAIQLVTTQGNTCALAVNFAPGEAETGIYVGRVAPITLVVYTLSHAGNALSNIEQLRNHTVGAINIAEVRDLLGTAGIPFIPVDKPSLGIPMLKAGRFDAFISDVRPEVQSGRTPLLKSFTLARVERWVLCNAGMPPATLSAMRKALKEGLFALDTQPVWHTYAMDGFFLDTRRQWLQAQPQ